MRYKNHIVYYSSLACFLCIVSLAFYKRSASQSSYQLSGSTPLVLKLAHTLDPKHPVHKGILHMKEQLEELSSGKVTLDIYASGVLGGETQCVEQLQNGLLAFTKTSASPMEGFVPEMGVFNLPYVFQDTQHFWNTLNSELGKEMLQKSQNKNLLGLCYYDAGSRNFYTKDTPIRSPEDLNGLKIRVMNSKTAIDMVATLGASPTPISWGELYTSLQQGVVEGAENNLPSFYSNRHYEICKHFSLDGHTRIPDMLLVSTRVWDKLPKKVQEWVQIAADRSSIFQRNLWEEKSKEALIAIQQEGVTVVEPDITLFQNKVEKLIAQKQETVVGEIYNRIQQYR